MANKVRHTICYLSNANSGHTHKWASQFASRGYDIHILSLEEPTIGSFNLDDGITVHWLHNNSKRQGGELQKLGYLCTVREARQLIESIDPNIVHAHFASSYGLICSLACKRPFYLSVWGSDVYEFPRKSILHKTVIKFVLRRAAWLMSTSNAMAKETRKYTEKPIEITPFGVDTELFRPFSRVQHQGFIVGTVKGLEAKYGIDCLLRGCALLHDRRPDLGLRLHIAGTGTKEAELKSLAADLGMDSYITWLGFISQEEAAREWTNFDVACVVSESESFGVSAVEAQACGVPLVITNIPGLMEACDGGRTAIVIPRSDYGALANALETLADDPVLREYMGTLGRSYTETTYEVNACFDHVEHIYQRNLK